MMKSLNLEGKTFFLVETLWTGSGSSSGSPWRLSGFVCSFPSVSGVISSVSVRLARMVQGWNVGSHWSLVGRGGYADSLAHLL